MKRQIIHNSLEDANAEVSLLLSKIKDSLDKNTTSYNKVVKHPTKKLYATRYLVDGKYWKIVKKEGKKVPSSGISMDHTALPDPIAQRLDRLQQEIDHIEEEIKDYHDKKHKQDESL